MGFLKMQHFNLAKTRAQMKSTVVHPPPPKKTLDCIPLAPPPPQRPSSSPTPEQPRPSGVASVVPAADNRGCSAIHASAPRRARPRRLLRPPRGTAPSPWRQPRGKSMVYTVNSYKMPPESGGICGRLTSDLPQGCLQGDFLKLINKYILCDKLIMAADLC